MSSRSDSFIIKGLEKQPLQIPVELLIAQKALGITAVMVWINMAMFEQQHQPVNVALISEAMNISGAEVNKALACLADHGWIVDEGSEIRLAIPELKPVDPDVELLDPLQKGFEWLINFWTNRVGVPTPEDMQKLMFWVEQKGMSHEVIAVAIEEMCNSIDNPHMGYLEGILRHWIMEGVTTYQQLLDKPYLAKVLNQSRLESQIHPESERKWKELFPDEFDS
ncbi:MAG TPA: DnaD domain protein [Firmicutes bacterium]|nr:DnaD domain protein [Bacillota bacterium]